MDSQLTDDHVAANDFRPTLDDADAIRHFLEDTCKLPSELAIRIVSLGYAPCIVANRADQQRYNAEFTRDDDEASVSGLYLSTGPVPTGFKTIIPKAIIFKTRAADQGWATFGGDGTFENSHTWFEASILRPLACDSDDSALSALATRTWWDTKSAKDDLNSIGWDFVETQGGDVTWRVSNNVTARREFTNYTVAWRRGIETEVEDDRAMGKGEGFLELLEPGFRVAVWARAEQRFWTNNVGGMKIEIQFEVP